MTQELLDSLNQEIDHAEQIERENRKSGTPESKAYDAGRITGMRDLLDLVSRHLKESKKAG